MAVYGDEEWEADEEFTVRLSEPENAVLERAVATGTIVDDDLGAMRRRALRVSLAAFARTLAEDVVETVGGALRAGTARGLAGQHGGVHVDGGRSERPGRDRGGGGGAGVGAAGDW